MKKILKIFIGLIILLLAALIIIPLFFEDKIIAVLKETINKNINATVDFKDLDISLISNFPNAKVGINELLIV